MNNIKVFKDSKLNEKTYYTKLDNGLDIYICKKEGYNKKIGLFGTKYGSVINDFIDITTNERTNVPDGVAHFLEHKLFEQEGENALDLFSKEGISANAYTTFDHTVYYFETITKFKKGLEMLIKLVQTPYFTDENVEKEKGIIEQEISMYEDDPYFSGYFNLLQNLYLNNNVRIDIAGTKDTIAKITKETLYKCYNTFYNLDNMFMIIVGDVNVEETIEIINNDLEKYTKNKFHKKVTSYSKEEPSNINKDYSEKKLSVYMPKISIGYKLTLNKDNIIKNNIISEFISEIYFSNLSSFYKSLYEEGLVSGDMDFSYDGSTTFSHVIIGLESMKPEIVINRIKEYIEKIKNEKVDKKIFQIIKNKKIGNSVISSENMRSSYKNIIENILTSKNIYSEKEILYSITEEDISNFLNKLDVDKFASSVVK